jgi:hypothetical protein
MLNKLKVIVEMIFNQFVIFVFAYLYLFSFVINNFGRPQLQHSFIFQFLQIGGEKKQSCHYSFYNNNLDESYF